MCLGTVKIGDHPLAARRCHQNRRLPPATGTPDATRNRAEARQLTRTPDRLRIRRHPPNQPGLPTQTRFEPDAPQSTNLPPPQTRPSYRINGSLLVVIEDDERGIDQSCPTSNRPRRPHRPHKHPCLRGCSRRRKSRFTRGSGSGSSSPSSPFLLLP